MTIWLEKLHILIVRARIHGMKATLASISISVLFMLPCISGADDVIEDVAGPRVENKPKLYRSPSERREAGLGRKLTDWLSVSGLVELESEYQDFDLAAGAGGESGTASAQSLQLGLNFLLAEQVSAEFVLEYEVNVGNSIVDEAILKYQSDEFSVEGGRLYIPFGEYFSHFVTGPILELGETRGNSIVAEYAITDRVDLFAYGIEGMAQKQGGGGGRVDWGGGFEYANEDESFKISAGYYSDMADTDAQFLSDFDNRYRKRVGGLSLWSLIGYDTFEITAEYLGATSGFDEIDPEADRPWAANLEIAWFPRHNFQLAGRIEGSQEVEDEPEVQVGISATWLIVNRINLSVDYLYGRYQDNFVLDDDDNEIRSRQLLVAQLVFEF